MEHPKDFTGEVYTLSSDCYSCGASCPTKIKLQKIPHFEEVILMATVCEACGYKTSEVKSGQGIGEKGVKIVFHISTEEDLKREVVRSDDCSLVIPEVELDIGRSGSGKYTTVEGLITPIIEGLKKIDLFRGDEPGNEEKRAKLNSIIERLQKPVGLTIELDDPCGHSYIEGATNVTSYERSNEQNEELGLNQMNTDQ